MPNWFNKIIAPTSGLMNKSNLPALVRASMLLAAAPDRKAKALPNASIVYGIAASVFFVIAVYFLILGAWFTGLLMFLPAACFLGFSLYFIKVG